MRLVRVAWVFIALFFLTWGWILWKVPKGQAQEPTPSPVPADISEIVKKQFGTCFQLASERGTADAPRYLHPKTGGQPWVNFLTTDLDGDGVEDAVIVARCKTPLKDEVAFNYKVIDPYYANYGFGDPRVTAEFNMNDPLRQNLVLVIQGAGKEGWRATTPKAKWVIINLPFDSISLTKVMHKKHAVAAVSLVEEEEQLSSAVFWDGKKWKWADTAYQ